MEFDEQDAIKYIKEATGLAYDDDQLLNVIDIIWDWYEDHDLLDINFDEDDDVPVDAEALTAHVAKMLRKDRGSVIDAEHVAAIVAAELAYENTLEL